MSRLASLALVALFGGLSMLYPQPAPAVETITVAVKKTSIRASNAFFSTTLTTVSYKTRLRVIENTLSSRQ